MVGKSVLAVVSLLVAVALVASPLRAADSTIPVEIQVAPATLLLGNVQSAVTVHTDIAYGSVVPTSVTLNGLEATATFADSCGNLVAKFDEAAVKSIVAPPSAVLTLEGTTRAGLLFEGSASVLVRPWPKK